MTQRDPAAEAERWLAQAENDLAFAEHGVELGFYSQACFLAQQSAEKGRKAVHYRRGARLVLGHSAAALLKAEEAEAGGLRDGTKELNQHYVPARYPNSLPGTVPFQAYGEAQARRAVGHARRTVEFVQRRAR